MGDGQSDTLRSEIRKAFNESKAVISEKFFKASSPQGMGSILEAAERAKEHPTKEKIAAATKSVMEDVGAGIATPFVAVAEMAKQDIKYLKR